MKKIVLLSLIYIISLDGFVTSNGKYSCDLGYEKNFKDSTDKKDYYMKLFFCKSTGNNSDGFYKFISYNLYDESDKIKPIASENIGLPPCQNDNVVFDITNMKKGLCTLRVDIPCFEFRIGLKNNNSSFFYKTLRICHSSGYISVDNANSLWMDGNKNTLLKDAVYDSSQ